MQPGSRSTKYQLLIDETALKDFKIRNANLVMVSIDYKKAFYFMPHSWINERMEMFEITEIVKNFLQRSMEQRKLALVSNGKDLVDADVKTIIIHRALHSKRDVDTL